MHTSRAMRNSLRRAWSGDYLRADDPARQAWGAFKRRLAVSVTDYADYGQLKRLATEILMRAAEQWAASCGASRRALARKHRTLAPSRSCCRYA